MDLLTAGSQVYAKKRKARSEQPEFIAFDADARRDFLLGFHRRKVKRQQEARQKAVAREKDERRTARRERRSESVANLKANLKGIGNKRVLKEITAKVDRPAESREFGASDDDNDDNDDDKSDNGSDNESANESGSDGGSDSEDETNVSQSQYTAGSMRTTVVTVSGFDPDAGAGGLGLTPAELLEEEQARQERRKRERKAARAAEKEAEKAEKADRKRQRLSASSTGRGDGNDDNDGESARGGARAAQAKTKAKRVRPKDIKYETKAVRRKEAAFQKAHGKALAAKRRARR
ncbi:hypothetical protein GQ42DRAFT_161025 [Ramicandelaber brevisporus]|nr:hypothetical protein GQ42DRAFT_161025 [Ramicandelaber brevisporus]